MSGNINIFSNTAGSSGDVFVSSSDSSFGYSGFVYLSTGNSINAFSGDVSVSMGVGGSGTGSQ